MSTRIERRLAAKLSRRRDIKANGGGEWEHRISEDNGMLVNAPKGMTDGWVNNRFAVQLYREKNGWRKVMVRSHGSDAVHWREMQRIKNELFGVERMAVQVMPKESELVDTCNMYWMFLAPSDYRPEWEACLKD